jgi:hypothetical protein
MEKMTGDNDRSLEDGFGRVLKQKIHDFSVGRGDCGGMVAWHPHHASSRDYEFNTTGHRYVNVFGGIDIQSYCC